MELESVEVYFGLNNEGKRVVNYYDTEGLDFYIKRMITTEELERIENTTYSQVEQLLSNYI